MKILIENSGYSIANAGDSAMLEAAIKRLKIAFPESEINVFTVAPELLKLLSNECLPASILGQHIWFSPYMAFVHNLFPGTNKWHISHFEWILRQKYPKLFLRLFELKHLILKRNQNELDDFIRLIRTSDLVVSSGGGYITDSFKNKCIATLGILGIAQAFDKPTVMLGHGLGPLEETTLRKKARLILPKVNLITLREGQKGPSLLHAFGVDDAKIKITGDDAIELAYSQRMEAEKNGIGVNIRLANYSGMGDEIVESLRQVLQKFASLNEAPLVPVPIDFDKSTSDINSIKQLTRDYSNVLEFPEGTVYPKDVAKQAGLCRLVVTGSYHAGVFALSQGIPVIGLAKSKYYQDKFNGLSRQFDGGVEVIDLSQDDFPEELKGVLQKSWDSSANLREKLLESAREQIDLSRKAYEEIRQFI
jgi:polysaccharide pyruvyl transferase WcaK-like protein